MASEGEGGRGQFGGKEEFLSGEKRMLKGKSVRKRRGEKEKKRLKTRPSTRFFAS